MTSHHTLKDLLLEDIDKKLDIVIEKDIENEPWGKSLEKNAFYHVE